MMGLEGDRAVLTGEAVGGLIRDWRRRRRMSQLDLACDANISAKHVSFLESGRSNPSRAMLLLLAECLDVPLRTKNAMLIAAGHTAAFKQRDFTAPAMAVARRTVESLLAAHDPNPAMVIDHHWTVLCTNKAVANLVAGAEPILLRPPVNLLRLMLHPAGLASRIVNLAEWRGHIAARLRREIDLTGDTGLTDLLEEIRDYPCPRGAPFGSVGFDGGSVAIPFQLVTIDGTLSFFNTTTRFTTPTDITLAELAIEAFLPADQETIDIMRRSAQRTVPRDMAAQTVEARVAALSV